MRDYIVSCTIYSNRIAVIPCIRAEDLGENLRRAVEGCRKLTHTCIWEIVHIGQRFTVLHISSRNRIDRGETTMTRRTREQECLEFRKLANRYTHVRGYAIWPT